MMISENLLYVICRVGVFLKSYCQPVNPDYRANGDQLSSVMQGSGWVVPCCVRPFAHN